MRTNWVRFASVIGFALTLAVTHDSFATAGLPANTAAHKSEQRQLLSVYKDRLARASLLIGANGGVMAMSRLQEATHLRSTYMQRFGKDVGIAGRLKQKYVEWKMRRAYPNYVAE